MSFWLHLVSLSSSFSLSPCSSSVSYTKHNHYFLGREPNYFEVLGLQNTGSATEEEITQRYNELSNKFNPAFNTDPENLVRFKKIQEAYQCIKSFPCRIQYKKFGAYIQSLSVAADDSKGSGGQAN